MAISNERIVGVDASEVIFRVCADPESGRKRIVRLSGVEFIDRFLQHVLPTGFKRIPHYGLLSPARKTVGLAATRAALGVPPPDPAVIESVATFLRRVSGLDAVCCQHCGCQQFRFVARRRSGPNGARYTCQARHETGSPLVERGPLRCRRRSR